MGDRVGSKFCKVYRDGLEVLRESITLGVKIIIFSVACIFLIIGRYRQKYIYLQYLND